MAVRQILIVFDDGTEAVWPMRLGYELAAERAKLALSSDPAAWLGFISWSAAKREGHPSTDGYADAWRKWVDAEVVHVEAVQPDAEEELDPGDPI